MIDDLIYRIYTLENNVKESELKFEEFENKVKYKNYL